MDGPSSSRLSGWVPCSELTVEGAHFDKRLNCLWGTLASCILNSVQAQQDLNEMIEEAGGMNGYQLDENHPLRTYGPEQSATRILEIDSLLEQPTTKAKKKGKNINEI